jgi:hypothetical protein
VVKIQRSKIGGRGISQSTIPAQDREPEGDRQDSVHEKKAGGFAGLSRD